MIWPFCLFVLTFFFLFFRGRGRGGGRRFQRGRAHCTSKEEPYMFLLGPYATFFLMVFRESSARGRTGHVINIFFGFI